eukprot:CAMPEP_0174986270 /NCGR_PEP_ID=MMETSP0004_2-20121128/18833_1 /TAXON_ID=420556 /ORGANISM="Ochromonas sp., Strain CCMP1393" /LENGTH=422 /DNA_ID=CAMNT_0016239069 /DNA_START=187 /DNA_END=1455 /DNA_ORIENTATION=+
MKDTTRKSVCVVGGGFGGLYSALKIAGRSDKFTDVYLVDPKDNFVFLPLLYELSVGTASTVEVAPRYESLLMGSKVKYLKAAVTNVDFDNKVCKLEQSGSDHVPESLEFDKLVLSVGIQPRVDLIPGAKENSLPFYTVSDAFKLKKDLKTLKASKKPILKVTVIGGGYSGVEVATNVAENLGADRVQVTIIDRNEKIMSTSPDHNRNAASKSLAKRGIVVSYNTTVQSVKEDGLVVVDSTGEPKDVPADLVLFTAGTEQSNFVKSLDLAKDDFGRILTQKTLQSASNPNIFALGDCSAVGDASNPATAQVAMQQSGVVAKNVLRSIKYERKTNNAITADTVVPNLEEFKYVSLGEMLTLGDTNAAITSLGGWVKLSGPLAALSRRTIYAVRMPTVTQSVKAMVTAGAVTTGKLIGNRFKGGK